MAATGRVVSQVPILDRSEERPQLKPEQICPENLVPILDRSEERPQFGGSSLGDRIDQLFQSSIAPKSDRNLTPVNCNSAISGVPILDRSEERPQFDMTGGINIVYIVPILDRSEERPQFASAMLAFMQGRVPILDRSEERPQ